MDIPSNKVHQVLTVPGYQPFRFVGYIYYQKLCARQYDSSMVQSRHGICLTPWSLANLLSRCWTLLGQLFPLFALSVKNLWSMLFLSLSLFGLPPLSIPNYSRPRFLLSVSLLFFILNLLCLSLSLFIFLFFFVLFVFMVVMIRMGSFL